MAQELDIELSKITAQDHEYAKDLLEDLAEGMPGEQQTIVAQWLRKSRYEAVMADRKARRVDSEVNDG